MCDGPDTGGMGPGGAGGVANGGGSAGYQDDFGNTVGGYIKNNFAKLLTPTPIGLAMAAVEAIPDKHKSPGGPLGDSKQGSTEQSSAGDSAPRSVLTQAATAKADDQRRASRGKTVLTSPAIRKPSLTKKETLGTAGTLG